jgi:integrase
MLLMYGSGLRVSEVVNVAGRDALLERSQRKVCASRGAKDRLMPVSPSLVGELVWLIGDRGRDAPLFPSLRGGALHERSVQHLVSAARARADLGVHVTCHSLRHAFATRTRSTLGALCEACSPSPERLQGTGTVSTEPRCRSVQ